MVEAPAPEVVLDDGVESVTIGAPAAAAPAGAPADDAAATEVGGIIEDQGGAQAQAGTQNIGVASAQANAGAQLALTGTDAWKLFVMLAITLMAAGVLCMRWGRLI